MLVMILIPIGTALLFPAASAHLSQRCDPKQLGQVMGGQQAFGAVARIVGPIWAGAPRVRDDRFVEAGVTSQQSRG